MPHLVTYGPRILQPDFHAGPNPEWARGLKLLWNGLIPTYGYGLGSVTTISGSPAQRGTTSGLSPDFATTQDYRWSQPAVSSSPTEVTLLALCALDSNVAEQTVLSVSSSGTNPLFRLESISSGSTWRFQARGDGGASFNLASASYTLGRMAVLVGVFRNGTQQKELWTDGVLRSTTTTDIGAITFDRTTIAVLDRGGSEHRLDGVVPLAAIWNRALSAGEVVELSRNPWHLFEPEPIHIYWPSAGGGGGFQPAWARNSNIIINPLGMAA